MRKLSFALVFLLAGMAHAQAPKPAAPIIPKPADAGAPDARASSDAGRRDAAPDHPGPVRGDEQLPPGHPAALRDDDPDGDGDDPHDPHGANNPHQGQGNGMFRAPQDIVDDDSALPPGTIAVQILDPENKPLPNVDVTLGILQQSVAKGDARRHVNQITNAEGAVRFDSLETGSGVAYRVTVPREGAVFAATPFQLAPSKSGMRVKLHVYPVTSDLEQALVVMQANLYAELKDDRIQFEEAINVYNFGRAAWVPDNLVMTLPAEFTALRGQESMSDQGVDAVEKRGARIHGTFAPGQHSLIFRWQLPYAGASNVDIRVGLPPRVAAARVLAAASQDMKLRVEGFPAAMPNSDMNGGRLLETTKEMQRGEVLRDLNITLSDIPTPGPARFIATGLAALGVVFGLGYAYQTRGRRRVVPKGDAKRTRQQLLFELEELERAHQAGDIGPKTYERARREIVDAIARTLAS
ncbi:carboxypeptidase-like regulatory domain-containing protein [Pendulispora brunnea]|uniref:Carboxypeptidase-like regulatory domain-containing protein n=1 Tax=Pendulispora brunnea TaxID=2905690 RepID=A0ABZ2K9J3_9BACT